MSQISDNIEKFLKNLLDKQNGILQLQRKELANSFNCSPSQINYVLETRFSPEMGYLIESRKGGGGYIKIVKISIQNDSSSRILDSQLSSGISLHQSIRLLQALYEDGIISFREFKLLSSIMEDRTLHSKDFNKNEIRSNILKNVILSLRSLSDE